MSPSCRPTRRMFLRSTTALVAGVGWAGPDGALAQQLEPTPACGEAPTARQTEGPFYKPRSPHRVDLRVQGEPGRLVELTGFVVSRSCRPAAGVLVDLWHADDAGDYDNSGFRHRGHQFTDAKGAYRFRTILPAVYPGRTRHYHVKVQPRGGRILTTQLYFPDEPANRRDGLYRPELLMRVTSAGEGLAARFDFVLDIR